MTRVVVAICFFFHCRLRLKRCVARFHTRFRTQAPGVVPPSQTATDTLLASHAAAAQPSRGKRRRGAPTDRARPSAASPQGAFFTRCETLAPWFLFWTQAPDTTTFHPANGHENRRGNLARRAHPSDGEASYLAPFPPGGQGWKLRPPRLTNAVFRAGVAARCVVEAAVQAAAPARVVKPSRRGS